MNRPEQEIHRAVFRHLHVRPAPGVFAFHPANGGKRSKIEAAILKGLGVKAGVPDVIAVRKGHAYALELKPERGRVSPSQYETMRQLREAGATTGIAYGLDDALGWLERHGLLRGRAA